MIEVGEESVRGSFFHYQRSVFASTSAWRQTLREVSLLHQKHTIEFLLTASILLKVEGVFVPTFLHSDILAWVLVSEKIPEVPIPESVAVLL